jgi:hypothetical protein
LIVWLVMGRGLILNCKLRLQDRTCFFDKIFKKGLDNRIHFFIMDSVFQFLPKGLSYEALKNPGKQK